MTKFISLLPVTFLLISGIYFVNMKNTTHQIVVLERF